MVSIRRGNKKVQRCCTHEGTYRLCEQSLCLPSGVSQESSHQHLWSYIFGREFEAPSLDQLKRGSRSLGRSDDLLPGIGRQVCNHLGGEVVSWVLSREGMVQNNKFPRGGKWHPSVYHTWQPQRSTIP